jgi:hypothetical protein
MKIFSFNVSWECMTNSYKGSAANLGKICSQISNNNFQCRDNLISYLRQVRNNYNEFDVLCFQEATNLEILKSEFDSNYLFHQNQSGVEKMITIINLNIFKVIDIIPSEFKSGRPFCIFILESILSGESIILVNLHYCGSIKRDNCDNITLLLTQSLKQKYPQYDIDFSNHRIIVVGDFNYHIHPKIISENNNILQFQPFINLNYLYVYKPFNSCCYFHDFNDKMKNVTDLIFDSKIINQITILQPKHPISDHLPIISILP